MNAKHGDVLRRMATNRHHLQGHLDDSHVRAAFKISEEAEAAILALLADLDAAREALRGLLTETGWLEQQLAVRGLPGRVDDSVGRAIAAARTALARLEGKP